MDIMQDYALTLYSFCNTLNPYLRPIRSAVTSSYAQITPILLLYLNRILTLASTSPQIVVLGLFILFILITLQIMNFMRRVIVFWTRLLMRITFWAGIVLLISAVWQRGIDRTVNDVMGWGRELSEVWWREYRRWEGFQNQAKGVTPGSAGIGSAKGRTGWR